MTSYLYKQWQKLHLLSKTSKICLNFVKNFVKNFVGNLFKFCLKFVRNFVKTFGRIICLNLAEDFVQKLFKNCSKVIENYAHLFKNVSKTCSKFLFRFLEIEILRPYIHCAL